MNAWRTPQRVVAADCPDQIADVGRDRRPADTTARLATPVQTEAAAMPAHQRLRLEDNRGFKPSVVFLHYQRNTRVRGSARRPSLLRHHRSPEPAACGCL